MLMMVLPYFAERLLECVKLGIVHTLEYKEIRQDCYIKKFNNNSVNLTSTFVKICPCQSYKKIGLLLIKYFFQKVVETFMLEN